MTGAVTTVTKGFFRIEKRSQVNTWLLFLKMLDVSLPLYAGSNSINKHLIGFYGPLYLQLKRAHLNPFCQILKPEPAGITAGFSGCHPAFSQ